MADGTLAANPQPGPTPVPQDGGPVPPNAPVQPGSGNPFNDPSTNPSAPVNAPEGDGPTPEASGAEGLAAFADESPGNFLKELFGDQDIELAPAAPAAPQAPTSPPAQAAGTAPVQPQAVNGVGQPPAPTNALPPAAPGTIDPRLLQQVLSPAPQPPAPVAYVPPGQPQQPAVAPQAQTPQPQTADPTDFVPFPQGFGLPPNVRAALEHDDTNTRHSALEATIGAAANETAKRVLAHVVQNILPSMAAATVNTTRSSIAQDRMMEDIFDGAPQLRFASPQLVQQCLDVVKRDELARNPGAVWTKDIGKRVQSYAVAALQAMASGQSPQFAPQPQALPPMPPQPAYAPPGPPAGQPYPVTQPEQGQDGRWYVKMSDGQWAPYTAPAPVAYHPQAPAPVPWTSGSPASGFGMPQPAIATPASEWADFQANGGWN